MKSRYHTFLENALIPIDVCEKEVERLDPLFETALHFPPLFGGDHAGDQIEGKDPLGGLLPLVEREGDPAAEERRLCQTPQSPEVRSRQTVQPLDDTGDSRVSLPVTPEELVVGVFESGISIEEGLARS